MVLVLPGPPHALAPGLHGTPWLVDAAVWPKTPSGLPACRRVGSASVGRPQGQRCARGSMVETSAGPLRSAASGRLDTGLVGCRHHGRTPGQQPHSCLPGTSPFQVLHRLRPSTHLGVVSPTGAETPSSPRPRPCVTSGPLPSLYRCWAHPTPDLQLGLRQLVPGPGRQQGGALQGSPRQSHGQGSGCTRRVQLWRQVARAGQTSSGHGVRH